MTATYSVKDLANRYDVNEHSILAWISNGELAAINVGRAPGKKKPRWRVTEQAVQDFELLRSAQASPAPRKRRRKQNKETIQFYK